MYKIQSFGKDGCSVTVKADTDGLTPAQARQYVKDVACIIANSHDNTHAIVWERRGRKWGTAFDTRTGY